MLFRSDEDVEDEKHLEELHRKQPIHAMDVTASEIVQVTDISIKPFLTIPIPDESFSPTSIKHKLSASPRKFSLMPMENEEEEGVHKVLNSEDFLVDFCLRKDSNSQHLSYS